MRRRGLGNDLPHLKEETMKIEIRIKNEPTEKKRTLADVGPGVACRIRFDGVALGVRWRGYEHDNSVYGFTKEGRGGFPVRAGLDPSKYEVIEKIGELNFTITED